MRLYLFVLSTMCVLLLPAGKASAAGLIRDAEIEQVIHTLLSPLLKAANLPENSVNIFIVDDPAINAYVAGGSNMFIHTGLLLEAKTPEMLVGVLAHELGHIAGSHLALGTEKLAQARVGTVVTYILAAAAAAAGGGEAGMAAIQAGHHATNRGLLAFTRAHEQFADQAALRFLEDAQISASGMLEMFETLRRHEKQHFGDIDPYSVTHPLGKERIAHIRGYVDSSPIKGKQLSADIHGQYSRMHAKLYGFLNDFDAVRSVYPKDDASFEAQYARAIALYRKPDITKALLAVDGLIAARPKDPFMHELKGQVLFEYGKLAPAVASYKKAHTLYGESPLINLGYGQALLALYKDTGRNNKKQLADAITHLEFSSLKDNTNIFTWSLLVEAYGMAGDKGKMYLAMAEEAAVRDNMAHAAEYSEKAMGLLAVKTAAYLRARDLNIMAMRENDKK